MSALQDAMRMEAGRVWREKARAESFGLFMNEETITETILLHIAMKFQGSGVWVQPFTKAQETKYGADWEFWFIQGPRAVGLRVQAKRLFANGRYSSLDPAGPQTRTLIKQAGNCFPVFILYNDQRSYPKKTPECLCEHYRGPSYLGCTLAPATTVSRLGSNDAAVLATRTIPWHCLLCRWTPGEGEGLPSSLAKSLNMLRPKAPMAASIDDSPCEVVMTPKLFLQYSENLPTDSRRESDEYSEEPDWLGGYLQEHRIAGVALLAARSDA